MWASPGWAPTFLSSPEGTLTNITAALLTAEPTDLTLDKGIVPRLARLKGVGKVGRRSFIFRTDAAGWVISTAAST